MPGSEEKAPPKGVGAFSGSNAQAAREDSIVSLEKKKSYSDTAGYKRTKTISSKGAAELPRCATVVGHESKELSEKRNEHLGTAGYMQTSTEAVKVSKRWQQEKERSARDPDYNKQRLERQRLRDKKRSQKVPGYNRMTAEKKKAKRAADPEYAKRHEEELTQTCSEKG